MSTRRPKAAAPDAAAVATVTVAVVDPDADARETLGEAFIRALSASWETHGAAAIEAVRESKPDLYLKLVTAMLPKEPEPKASAPDELDDATLDRRIAALAAALGLAIGSGEGAGGKGKAAAKKPSR